MGGALALAGAVHVDEIVAAAPFCACLAGHRARGTAPHALTCTHMTPPTSDGTANDELADVTKITCPVLAHFGEEDDHAGFADAAAAAKLRGQLQTAGVEHEVVVVPGAGHGFMNRTDGGKALNAKLGRPDIDEKRIADAWERVLAFFDKHLA